MGNDMSQGGFAATGRSPEDQGGYTVGFDHDAQRLARSKQVLLSAELVQCAGPHPFRQRRSIGPAKK